MAPFVPPAIKLPLGEIAESELKDIATLVAPPSCGATSTFRFGCAIVEINEGDSKDDSSFLSGLVTRNGSATTPSFATQIHVANFLRLANSIN